MTPVDRLGLGIRLTNVLKARGMGSVARLLARSQEELQQSRNIGRVCVGVIRESLVAHGFITRAVADVRYSTGFARPCDLERVRLSLAQR